jgi:hypothetical protein
MGQDNDLNEFYNFLIVLSKYITYFPTKYYILLWSSNFERLMKIGQYLFYMNYETLSTKIADIYWGNHYFIFYYIYSLQI